MSGMNLYRASRQWATRPADERFETIDDLIAQTRRYADDAREAVVETKDLSVVVTQAPDQQEQDLALVAGTGQEARFSHWSFGQLSQRVGAPADYLRRLPAPLAAENLNHGLASRRDGFPKSNLLIHANGDLVVRAFTSEQYARIWNWEVAERLSPLVADGWRVPPARPALADQPGTRPATDADVLAAGTMGLSIRVGDPIAPAGLYASDHDMFVFLVNEELRVREVGNDLGLARGVFVENSEVGASSLRVTRFLYREVCGNHIVWDAKNVLELNVRHVGDIGRKSGEFFATIREYAQESASEDEARIARAMTYKIGDTKEQVLDAIFGKGILSRKQAALAFETCEQTENIDPRTAWGMAQGVTRMSQTSGYADKRADLDRAAGRITRMAF